MGDTLALFSSLSTTSGTKLATSPAPKNTRAYPMSPPRQTFSPPNRILPPLRGCPEYVRTRHDSEVQTGVSMTSPLRGEELRNGEVGMEREGVSLADQEFEMELEN